MAEPLTGPRTAHSSPGSIALPNGASKQRDMSVLKPDVRPSVVIVVGPENPSWVKAIEAGLAPRLDYRLVARRCHGVVKKDYPSPAALEGARLFRILRSALANLPIAAQLVRSVPAGGVIYSTAWTWGLPIAMVGGVMRGRRPTHIVCGHRIYSPFWLRLIHGLRSFLRVDGWLCITRHQARLMRRALGPEGAPVATVGQGVDTAFYDPDRAMPPEQRPYLLSMGIEMRNYPLLFEAVRGLDVQLVVKASSAWMTRSRYPIGPVPPNVRVLTEHISHTSLRDLYAGASLVILPLIDSPQAAGITSILEAMAMEKCVIATRSRGLPDALVHGSTGVIVEPSERALARAILMWSSEPDRLRHLVAKGCRVARTEMSIETYASRVATFISQLMTPRRTAPPT